MIDNPIISTSELETNLANPNWTIFDCRFDLQKTEVGHQLYLQNHIPGALFMDLNRDLSGPVTTTSGRHPLPEVITFIEKLNQGGVTNSTSIVVYDASGGAFAARMWFMLSLLPLKSVYVLDGGFQKWQNETRPLESGAATAPNPTNSGLVSFDKRLIAVESDIKTAIQSRSYVLIDARSAERYSGESEPIDPVAGHIPTALNRFHGENLQTTGIFKTPETLHSEFSELLLPHPTQDSIIYCGSGVTSCHHILAMRIAGLPPGRVYIGSWSEWIKNPDNPFSTSSKP